MNHEYYWIMYLSHILIFVILIRTEKMLEDSGDTVQPPPRAGSSLVASGGRPVRQAARISRSDMVIEEGESEGNTDSTYQSESQDSADLACICSGVYLVCWIKGRCRSYH